MAACMAGCLYLSILRDDAEGVVSREGLECAEEKPCVTLVVLSCATTPLSAFTRAWQVMCAGLEPVYI